MANTSLDQSVVTKVAADHRETAGDITNQIKAFSDAVNMMDDYCSGAMIDALNKAHDRWTDEANRIVADLNAMAEKVDGSVQDIDTQDVGASSTVDRVGISILQGI